MKIILTGATGFIGGEILSYCLRNPSITSIVALIRRHLPDSHLSGHTSDPQQLSKLQQCVIEDFTAPWPQTVFEACRGAEACIWALGSKTQKMDEARRVGLDFTINTVKQIQERLLGEANGQERKHFRFVVVSGIITVRDQSKSLWFLSDIRKLGGERETKLLSFEADKESPAYNQLQVYIARPAYVLQADMNSVAKALMTAGGMMPAIQVTELAAAMVELALHGAEEPDKAIFENAELAAVGRKALSERANMTGKQ